MTLTFVSIIYESETESKAMQIYNSYRARLV